MCIALKLGFSSTHRRAVSIPKYGQTPHFAHTMVQLTGCVLEKKFYFINFFSFFLTVPEPPKAGIFTKIE